MADRLLLITGPVTSRGKSGRHLEKDSSLALGPMARDVDVVMFDSMPNLIRLAGQAHDAAIVLTTWRSEAHQVSTAHPVLLLDDPGPAEANGVRQSVAIVEALRALLARGAISPTTTVMRVRADQTVDTLAAFSHVERLNAEFGGPEAVGQTGWIVVSSLFRSRPYAVGDFYFGGHAGDLLRFFDAHLALAGHSLGAGLGSHTNLTRRYAWRHLRGYFDAPTIRYFPEDERRLRPNGATPSEFVELWQTILSTAISVFPRHLFEDATWRGDPIAGLPDDLAFFEEWRKAKDTADVDPLVPPGGIAERRPALVGPRSRWSLYRYQDAAAMGAATSTQARIRRAHDRVVTLAWTVREQATSRRHAQQRSSTTG